MLMQFQTWASSKAETEINSCMCEIEMKMCVKEGRERKMNVLKFTTSMGHY